MDAITTVLLPEEIIELPHTLKKIRSGNERLLNIRKYIDEKKWAFAGKRVFDICFSLLVIVFILSWLMPIIALLIRLDSRGPIFFLQKRVGRGGLDFTCFKFRTMISDKNPDRLEGKNTNPHITGIGKFLRLSNLDELPQFFNVLLGSMSVVGPRPHIQSDCKRFSHYIKNYHYRNLTRPGITGLAQVKGYHGPVADPIAIFRRYQWDMIYIKKFRPLLDIYVVCKTAWQRISWLFRFIFQLL